MRDIQIAHLDKSALGRHVGFLFERQEAAVTEAIVSAFSLH
jgi:hypothetical protein